VKELRSGHLARSTVSADKLRGRTNCQTLMPKPHAHSPCHALKTSANSDTPFNYQLAQVMPPSTRYVQGCA
jgi:hypothetical protein